MGPRKRRRLAAAAGGGFLVAAVAAVVMLVAHSAHHTDKTSADAESTVPHSVVVRAPITGKLSYGMTRLEVQRVVGKPTKTVRDRNGSPCWQYELNRTRPGLDGAEHRLDAVRVCFVDGRYSLDYTEVDGKWDYTLPKIKVTS